MQWIDKQDELPDRGETVLFGYTLSTGGYKWKEYKVAIFDRIEDPYVINNSGHIVCKVKDWKCWSRIDEFPRMKRETK